MHLNSLLLFPNFGRNKKVEREDSGNFQARLIIAPFNGKHLSLIEVLYLALIVH